MVEEYTEYTLAFYFFMYSFIKKFHRIVVDENEKKEVSLSRRRSTLGRFEMCESLRFGCSRVNVCAGLHLGESLTLRGSLGAIISS